MNQQLPTPSSNESQLGINPTMTRDWYAAVRAVVAKTVTGQAELIEQLFLTVLCHEHALLEGPAGTAKWLAVEALGQSLGLSTRRIRCSHDLTKEEWIGDAAKSSPWQSSLLLLDNVDDLSPKVRNLVQEAMAERVVKGQSHRLAVPDPFVVFAGRFHGDEHPVRPIADPYDDRFIFQIDVPYPSYHEEYAVADAKSSARPQPIEQVVSHEQLMAWQTLVRCMQAPPSVIHYAVRLVRATRVHEGENLDFVYEWVQQGAGPRGAHFLVLAAKARTTLQGRSTVSHSDVQAVCLPVLRHRILTNQNARMNGIGADRVVRRLIEEVPPRVVGDETIPAPGQSFTFHDWIPAEEP
jgi:MoxR-like ATPase